MLPPQPARSEPSAPWPRRTCPAWPTRATKAKPTVGAVGDRFIMIRDLSGNPSNVFGAEGELLLSREYGIPPTRGTEQVTVNGNTRRPLGSRAFSGQFAIGQFQAAIWRFRYSSLTSFGVL